MKYILWKRLKTKAINVFEHEDIQKVLDFAITQGYEYTGQSYLGGFTTFTNGKHSFSVQGQYNGIVCSYPKATFIIKSKSDLAIA